MKIMLGEYELVESGVVIQIKDNPIKITLPDGTEGDFNFIFNFLTVIGGESFTIQLSTPDTHTVVLNLTNFHNSTTSSGNIELISVGTLCTIPLFLNFRVIDMSNVGKTLTFNFYLKREVQDGNK